MTPIVSLLLLTYNHSEFIAQAINSILEQKVNFDYEILIGDDCSSDGTCEIVDSYAKKYPNLIKTIRSEQNVGALRNEKRLMEASQGKYIAFLEGDDYWVDQFKLQKQVDFLEANPDYGLVHGDVNHYYQDSGKTLYKVNTESQNISDNVFISILKPNPLFIKTATVCFRKELINHFNYDLAIKQNWPLTDLPLWLDISYNSKIHYFDQVFATYRLLNESASRTKSFLKKLEYHKGLFKIKKHYIEKYNCDKIILKTLEEDYNRGLIKIAYNLNDKIISEEAFTHLKSHNYNISIKEYILNYATKNKIIYKTIKMLRNE
jgi:glycosyltransferase involved in cell wall biosynthesis